MAKQEPPAKPERLTLAGQLARQHELLIALVTKSPRQGSQTLEWGERSTGATSGTIYFKSVGLVQHEEEDDMAFLGRNEAFMLAAIEVRDRLNAAANPEPAPEAGETE